MTSRTFNAARPPRGTTAPGLNRFHPNFGISSDTRIAGVHFLSRSAFPITDTELRLIAAAAIIGESSRWYFG